MPKTYAPATPDLIEVRDRMIAAYYPWITECGVTFNMIFAFGPKNREGVRTGPAIKLHGWAAAATVQINSLDDRVKGLKDVTLKVDGDRWPDWPDKKRLSVLDHELYHLVKHFEPDGTFTLDDCGRPKLTLLDHDFEFGGFRELAIRHGEDSFEVLAIEQAYEIIAGPDGQLQWPWATPQPRRKLEAS